MNDTISCIYYLTREVDFVAEGKKNLVVTIDEELHQTFKIHCTEQKTSIKEMIIKLISKELEEAQERRS